MTPEQKRVELLEMRLALWSKEIHRLPSQYTRVVNRNSGYAHIMGNLLMVGESLISNVKNNAALVESAEQQLALVDRYVHLLESYTRYRSKELEPLAEGARYGYFPQFTGTEAEYVVYSEKELKVKASAYAARSR